MKTDDLVALLATDATPVPRRAAGWRMGLALASGGSVAVAWLVCTMGLRPGLWHDITMVLHGGSAGDAGELTWIKLLYPASIAIASCVWLERLARPGARARWAWLGIALPLVAMACLAGMAWRELPADARPGALWGGDWRMCLEDVLLMAVPVFVMALLALRSLAPTRPALAGGVAGLMSGAAGAAVYALHCPETALPFVAVWYAVGMLIPVGVGTLIGGRVLRW